MTIKSTISTGFALFLILNLFSQTPIQRDDLIGTIGEVFITNYTDVYNPGSTGANGVWDVTGGALIQQASFEYVTVESTPFAGSFQNADYCIASSLIDEPASGFTYFSNDGPDENFEGIAYTGTIISHNDPQLFWKFPITYGDTFEDYFESTFESGATWFRSGTSTYTVDGYGSLILPYGTIEDVYRVSTIQDYSDETDGFLLDYYVEYYSFVKAGTHNYIASVQSIMVEQTGQLSQYTIYLDEASVGIEESLTLKNEIIIAPNPLTDIATITVENDNDENILVELVDLMGRKIDDLGFINSSYNNTIEHDFSSLSSGLYLVKISTDKAFAIKKIIVQ